MKTSPQEIVALVRETLDVPSATLHVDTLSSDVDGWDSLGQLRICLALEETFRIKIPLERMPELNSIPAITRFLNALPE